MTTNEVAQPGPTPVGRPCVTCSHPDRLAIEQEIAEGTSLRAIADRHAVARSSIRRHLTAHMEVDAETSARLGLDPESLAVRVYEVAERAARYRDGCPGRWEPLGGAQGRRRRTARARRPGGIRYPRRSTRCRVRNVPHDRTCSGSCCPSRPRGRCRRRARTRHRGPERNRQRHPGTVCATRCGIFLVASVEEDSVSAPGRCRCRTRDGASRPGPSGKPRRSATTSPTFRSSQAGCAHSVRAACRVPDSRAWRARPQIAPPTRHTSSRDLHADGGGSGGGHRSRVHRQEQS